MSEYGIMNIFWSCELSKIFKFTKTFI
uniref:Uncharacterized protein n=1 Tax=Rhizophora mucronata TaxID=61149 RepID=A0A2P2JC97_RHIMU